MTENQKNYIKTLDERLEELGSSFSSENLLEPGWEQVYKSISYEIAHEVIQALLEEIKYIRREKWLKLKEETIT